MPEKQPIPPPLKGFIEASAFADQPPDSTPDSLNVVPFDPIVEKFRIALRPGTYLVDLFSFNSGETLAYPTPCVPICYGGPPTGGPPIAPIPIDGCYGIYQDSCNKNTDVQVIGGVPSDPADCGSTPPGYVLVACICGPSTIAFGPTQPATEGDGCGGGIVVTPIDPPGGPPGGGGTGGGGGGGGTITPPTNPCPSPPCTDPKRPWLKVRTCAGDDANFWVHQSVLAAFNALPALKDPDGNCYQVTGQRAASPTPLQDITDWEIIRTCADCISPPTKCVELFSVTWNCETEAFEEISHVEFLCAAITGSEEAPIVNGHPANQWIFESAVPGVTATFRYYKTTDTDCGSTGDCTLGDPPGLPDEGQAASFCDCSAAGCGDSHTAYAAFFGSLAVTGGDGCEPGDTPHAAMILNGSDCVLSGGGGCPFAMCIAGQGASGELLWMDAGGGCFKWVLFIHWLGESIGGVRAEYGMSAFVGPGTPGTAAGTYYYSADLSDETAGGILGAGGTITVTEYP